MSSNELDEKINNLIESDDTENFYSLVSEIIEENKEYQSELVNNLNEVFKILSDDINDSNQDKKISFICLFFEILISENIDFSSFLEKTFSIINQKEINSEENIKRIINICSNATIKKKDLFNNLISFSKNKIEYLYIIFSLAGFKDIIIDNLSENWELIIELLDNPEIKSNSNSIKNILKCLELLINLSEDKFKPYASSALYQALDYLTETDIELQKRSLMIIYSLTKYCDEQLQPLSENIIDFLKVLQNGNNIEINNLCNTMLRHFTGENVEEYENEENIENKDDINGNNNKLENKNDDKNGNLYQNDKKKENENEYQDDYENNQYNNNEEDEETKKNYNKEQRKDKDEDDEDDNKKYEPSSYSKKGNRYENEELQNEDNNDNNEEDNKYNYKKRKDQEEENKSDRRNKIVKIEKKSTNESNLNNIDINEIIKKIKDLSDKQIIILDSIEQYKRDTKRIINQKKLKIQSLEAKIEELQEKIRIEKNKKRNKQGRINYQMKRKNNNDYGDEDDRYNNDY